MTTPLPRVTPESQGIDSTALLRFVEAVESQVQEFHSLMLLRHGHVVAEGWWSPYGRDLPHMLFSLSKSFSGTAVGLAVAEGYFSVDDPVIAFFPEETPQDVNGHLAALRVRHLLSMSTGHAEDPIPTMRGRADGQWTKGFFDVPIVHEPGTQFLYTTGATYMLSAIVQKTTGLTLLDYLTPRLLEPLGIEEATWEVSPEGFHVGGSGMSIKTEDIARLGQLYLQKGLWNGKRLLSEAWVEEATMPHISNGDDPASDWAQGYGYQFWRCRHNIYRGDGAFGQYCVVMPEQDAVLVVTAGLGDMQIPLNLVWDILLPAMGADALPEDVVIQEKLRRKLSGLHFQPVEGAASSPIADQVSGRMYRVEENDLQIESMMLECAGNGVTLHIQTATQEAIIPCGYGRWQAGQTHLFNESPLQLSASIMSSGAWTAANTFTAQVRRYETPFFHTLVCQFDGDRLTIQTRVNVGFIPPETVILRAHSL